MTTRRWIGGVAALLLLAAPGLAQVASVDYGVASIGFDPEVAGWDRATLTVAGPQGIVAEREFAAGANLDFDLMNNAGQFLGDGEYTWELVMVERGQIELEGGERIAANVNRWRETGFFRINGGVLASNGDEPGVRPRQPVGVQSPAVGVSQAVFEDDIFTVSAKIGIGTMTPVAPLHIFGTQPAILFEDSDTSDWWYVGADNAGFGIRNNPSGSAPDRRVIGVSDGAPADSLFISSTGAAGFGTATPATTMHLVAAKVVLRFENTSNDVSVDQTLDIAGDFWWGFTDAGGDDSTIPYFLNLQSSEAGTNRRGVGVHQPNPTASLHVNSCTGCKNAPLLKIDGANLGDGIPSQLQIISKDTSLGNASAALTYLDQASGEAATFEFRNFDSRIFFGLNFVGTGGLEFLLSKLGEMELGRGGVAHFSVDQFGNVSATSFNTVSARASKENFEAISPRDVLDRVAGLDISRWNYRDDASGVAHIGPIAEEFHAAFGVGSSDQQINLVDAAGVSLAAIQGLAQELETKNQQIDALAAEKSALEDRLSRLEALVEELANR